MRDTNINTKTRINPNSLTVILPIIIILLSVEVEGSTYVVSEEFHTQAFTTNDLNAWNVGGASVPAVKFTTCGSDRIFGGYGVLTGDQTNPNSLTRTWTGLIPHYSLTLTAKIYKIDSWPSNTIFMMVDGTSVATATFNSTNPGLSDICGTPTPIADSINTNFNDIAVTLTATGPHTNSAVTVTFISNLAGTTGAWGVRQVSLKIQACDQSCQSCTNGSACTSCIAGMVLSGQYCICSSGIRQNKVPCLAAPCTSCVVGCSTGFYLSTTTSNCEPCNIACSTCTSPANSLASCTICASNFIGSPTTGTLCQACFSGCSTCTSTSQSACLTCSYGYFLYPANNTCLLTCPSGWFGQQKTARCYSCSSPCATCLTATPQICLSCTTGYLFNSTCLSACTNNLYAYLGVCLSVCPQGTRTDPTYVCIACGSGCLECNLTGCVVCSGGNYIMGGVCYGSCPVGYYGDSSGVCLPCDGSCLTCSGPLNNNCLSCSTGSVVSGTCYSTCPTNSYSALCLPCHSTCLTCSGPSSSQCLSCPSPSFFHLNLSTCVTSCTKGQLTDNLNLTCLSCPQGQVGYYSSCVACDPACLTCDGVGFMACLSCETGKELVQRACVEGSSSKVVYAPDVGSKETEGMITTALVCFVGLAVTVQLLFSYKTALLPLLQILQILSYTYYLTLKLTPQTQSSSLLLYHTNFPFLFQPFTSTLNPLTPSKLAAMGKTGYYLTDSLGCHLCLLLSILIYLACKYIGQKIAVVKWVYTKINPYAVSYMFRLVLLEMALNAVLYLYCFQVQSVIGGLSLGLVVVDAGLLVVAGCWRVRTKEDGSQMALYYNNQIGERKKKRREEGEEEEERGVQDKIKMNRVLPAALCHCYKVPIPITILLFIDRPSTQCITLCCYFTLTLLLTALIPYRRKIYKFVVLTGSTFLLINSIIAILVLEDIVSSVCFDVLWLVAVCFGAGVVGMQAVVNYRYFGVIAVAVGNKVKLCWENGVANDNEGRSGNEESRSNLDSEAVDEYQQKEAKKNKKEKKYRQKEQKDNSKQRRKQAGQVPPISRADKNRLEDGYSRVEHNQTISEQQQAQEVRLDLNL